VILRGEDFGTVWEYQLKRGMRNILAGIARQAQHGIGASRCGLLIRRSLNRGGPDGRQTGAAFDGLLGVYRGARTCWETSGGVSALNWERHRQVLVEATFAPRLTEWERTSPGGRGGARRTGLGPRMVMFRSLLSRGLAPSKNARDFLGLSERSWVNGGRNPPPLAGRAAGPACFLAQYFRSEC